MYIPPIPYLLMACWDCRKDGLVGWVAYSHKQKANHDVLHNILFLSLFLLASFSFFFSFVSDHSSLSSR